MARFSLLLAVFCLLTSAARANPAVALGMPPGEQCRAAIAMAERGHAIPPQLLAAIGRMESGRKDPTTGVWGAWPWTINAEGQGAYFNSKAEAIAAVEGLRARGVRSIDVGCMQVNLMHHPAAFASLDQAFDPAFNADYAARFMLRLYAQTSDWTRATARYHSANPSEGDPYAARVMAFWPEEQRKAGQSPPPFVPPGRVSAFAGRMAPFPAPRPPRVLPLPGMFAAARPPIVPFGSFATVPPPGVASFAAFPAGATPAGVSPLGMPALGMPPPGGTRQVVAGQGGAIQMAAGQGGWPAGAPNGGGAAPPGGIVGRGLDFYRAMPIRMAMPFRLVVQMPSRLMR